MNDECVFIYRTYHIVSQGGLQFYLSKIGPQLVKAPLAAAISPYVIKTFRFKNGHGKHKVSKTSLFRSLLICFKYGQVVITATA